MDTGRLDEIDNSMNSNPMLLCITQDAFHYRVDGRPRAKARSPEDALDFLGWPRFRLGHN